MQRRWPDILPTASFPGFGLVPNDKTRSTNMEVGLARMRQVTFARTEHVTMSWIFTDAEMAAFRAWFEGLLVSLAGDSDDLRAWTAERATVDLALSSGPSNCIPTRMLASTATGAHGIWRDFPGLNHADTDVVIFATLASNGLGYARIEFEDRSGAPIMATVDLTTGILVGGAGLDATLTDRGDGYVRLRLGVSTGSGAATPRIRIRAMASAGTVSFAGTGITGIHVCEVMVRVKTDFDLFLRSDANGNAFGAAGGPAWVLMKIATGGGFEFVEARFKGTFNARGGANLEWNVSAALDVRYA